MNAHQSQTLKTLPNEHQKTALTPKLCFLDLCLFVFLVASFTFYLADSDDRELTTPTGSEDNVISFVYLDPSESQISVGMEPDNELGKLTISGITPDGFDLSWKLKALSIYDSLAVEYKDTQRLWDVREVQLPGDATGSRIQSLNASTEYQIKLYGLTSSQRSALLEAVAVTGISFSFSLLGTFGPVVFLTASPFSGVRCSVT